MGRKGVAYRKMLASFAAVFVVPLCLVFLFYFFSYGVIEKQVEASNDNFVSTIQSTCDRELQYYKNALVQLSMNDTIRNIAKDVWDSKANQIEKFRLTTSLFEASTAIGTMGDGCADLFVYFPKAERLFSYKAKGSMRFHIYMSEYCTSDQKTCNTLKEDLSTFQNGEPYNIQAEKMGSEIVMITYCRDHTGGMSNATLGMLLDVNALVERTSSLDWSDGYDWVILDEKGWVVKDTSGEHSSYDTLRENDEYVIYTAPSEVSDWTYVLMMPRGSIRSSAGQIRTFFTLSILLSMLIAAVLIRKAVALNYEPLEKLLMVFQPQKGGVSRHENEYQFLDKKITELVSAKTSAEANVSLSKKPLQQWGLTNLLIKPYDPHTDKPDRQLAVYAEPYAAGENMVLLIKVRSDTQQEDAEAFSEEMKMFIIENVFPEKMGELLRCAMVEMEGRQVQVLHDSAIGNMMEQIQEAVYELQQFILESFGFRTAVSAGSIHQGADGIHKSYLEALEAEEFITVLDQDYINYEEIKDKTYRGYPYSLQAEERISAAVRNDNAQLAAALVDKVIDSNWANEQSSPKIRRLLMNDIYCTLLKTADEKGCIDQIVELPKNLAIEKPVAEIKAVFASVVRSICAEREADADTGKDKLLCAEVLEYIRKNYGDCNLNISQTAFHFHMTPAKMSSVYKNETGKSLLAVINEIRIEKAVEFLKQGCTIAETAKKVGIPESSSFIRLFKKQVGTTPGKMKESLQMID